MNGGEEVGGTKGDGCGASGGEGGLLSHESS